MVVLVSDGPVSLRSRIELSLERTCAYDVCLQDRVSFQIFSWPVESRWECRRARCCCLFVPSSLNHSHPLIFVSFARLSTILTAHLAVSASHLASLLQNEPPHRASIGLILHAATPLHTTRCVCNIPWSPGDHPWRLGLRWYSVLGVLLLPRGWEGCGGELLSAFLPSFSLSFPPFFLFFSHPHCTRAHTRTPARLDTLIPTDLHASSFVVP